MTDFVDTEGLLEDFRTLIEAQPLSLGFQKVFLNASDVDFLFSNAPLLDLRIRRGKPVPTTNATYYTTLLLEAEIVVYSMTSREEAAKLRSSLTNELQRLVKNNPRFSAGLETTIVGDFEFGTGESKAEGAFVAGAVLEFYPQLYTE